MEFKGKSLVVAIINSDGARSFRIPKNSDVNQRELYYIDRIETRGIRAQKMLLGRFLFEIENSPKNSLPLTTSGHTTRVYLNDLRIIGYDYPTTDEIKEFKDRMEKLTLVEPNYAEIIDQIIESIN